MKHRLIHLAQCIFLISVLIGAPANQAIAASHNNSWQSLPFIEMMAAMLKAMNNVMGGQNSFSNFSGLAYSPALTSTMLGMPGYNRLNSFPLNSFPMSPSSSFSGVPPWSATSLNALPLSSMAMDPLKNGFNTGSNATQFDAPENNFWDPNAKNTNHSEPFNQPSVNKPTIQNNNSLNGIWQTASGDVIAIYNNNRFLWSDGGAKNLAGQLAIKGSNLIAYIPARKITLYFQFYRENNQFIVRDKNSRTYSFKRIH